MSEPDRIFNLLKQFSEAIEYVIAKDGQKVTIIPCDSGNIDVDATTFKTIAQVNQTIASNNNKANPHAPISTARAKQLSPIFADAIALIKQAQWRAGITPPAGSPAEP